MDNQYQFIKQPAFSVEALENAREDIITNWENFNSLGVNDLGFLLQKGKDIKLPTWWLENKELFHAFVAISYSMYFLDDNKVIVSLRRGDDVLLEADQVKFSTNTHDTIDNLFKHVDLKSYGFPRRILTFGNIGDNKTSLYIGTLVTFNKENPGVFQHEDYINSTNLKDQGVDARTEIKEDFKQITTTFSELVYSANVRDVGKIVNLFNPLEEQCYTALYDEYRKDWMGGKLLVEKTPKLCFVHELAYYNGQIVDSFACRVVEGHPERCTCETPNCGTIHVEYELVDTLDPKTNRFIVLNQVNKQVISYGENLQ